MLRRCVFNHNGSVKVNLLGTFVYIIDVCTERNFALYTFDSDYLDSHSMSGDPEMYI